MQLVPGDEPSSSKCLRLFYTGLATHIERAPQPHAEIAWFVRDIAVALGYEVFNPLDLVAGASWATEIMHAIDSADVIVADVTAASPNLMFELGLATASAKPVLLVARSLDQVPFDLTARHLIAVEDGSGSARMSLASALRRLTSSKTPVTGVLTEQPAQPTINITVYSGTVFQGPITVSDRAVFAGGDANVAVNVQPGDLSGLATALQQAGLDSAAIADLERALLEDEQDLDHADGVPGPRFRSWWTRMTIGSGGVAGKVAIGASGGVIAKLIEAYFNMH